MLKELWGRVHKSVDLSLFPSNIMFQLYPTMHLNLSNVTSQPASVNTRIPNSEAIKRSGMICPIRVMGRPSILMSHICVDITCQLLTSETNRGQVMHCLLMTGVPSMMKNWLAPKSAIASFVGRVNAVPTNLGH
jgi:hypothetical protein